MSSLIHLIYSSAATKHFTDNEMVQLLIKSRAKNARLGITGMLLFENGSFFQILEGSPEHVDDLYKQICEDPRHAKVVTIIREPIPKRAFGDWTMGYSKISPEELDEITGFNDFFTNGSSFTQVNMGRAKKLLAAFREGRWRSKVKYTALPEILQPDKPGIRPIGMHIPKVSFSYQPIIDANNLSTVAYEALIRGQNSEDFGEVLPKIAEKEWTQFDTGCRAIAISLAAKLGLSCNLHLNYMARYVEDARAAIHSTLDAAERNGIEPSRIVLEIDQDQLLGDFQHFANIIDEYRGAGLRISIDHFGAGRAGLNLLEPLRPEMISLNLQLVRDIDSNGPRQAIMHGLVQTCTDLGIDIIAKHIETSAEYHWLLEEGINLMQGNIIAAPEFEKLPVAHFL